MMSRYEQFTDADEAVTDGMFSLLAGEKPLEAAPYVTLKHGQQCIPQHYLQYQHSLSSLESILLDVSYDERYPVFASEQNGQLYLQVGVIGFDNYRCLQKQAAKKIVYGRKWRVEPQLPSSELIQTVFLALQKAREHEVRELFKLRCPEHKTTPFSTHHDLPLMAKHKNMFLDSNLPNSIKGIDESLQDVCYDDARFKLVDMTQTKSLQCLVDIEMIPGAQSQLPEVNNKVFSLLLDDLQEDTLFFGLMDTFLMWSNRHIEEHFTFQGYPRFSRKNSVRAIADLSAKTRKRESKLIEDAFSAQFEHANYETDKTRVPTLSDSYLGRKLAEQIARQNVGEGMLPQHVY